MPYTFIDLGCYIYTKFINALWRIVPSKKAESTLKLVAEPTIAEPTVKLVVTSTLKHIAYNIYTKFKSALWRPIITVPSKVHIVDLIEAANVDLIHTNKFCYSTVILLPFPRNTICNGNNFYDQLWFFANKGNQYKIFLDYNENCDNAETHFVTPWFNSSKRDDDFAKRSR